MSGIPKGWVYTTIANITSDCVQKVPAADEEFQYIDISSIDRSEKTIVSPQALVGANAPSRARKLVAAGDVLVSMTRPNMNAVAMVPEKLNKQIASTGFDVLRANGIEPRWLFFLVRAQYFINSMSELVQGALYPAIRSKDVRGYEAPLAPLNEQKRIADKLDTVLARVDACRDRLDRVPAILKRFRQSVLAAATSGKLTEEWRETAQGVAEWHVLKISELVMANGLFSDGDWIESKDQDPNGDIRLIQLADIGDGCFVDKSKRFINEDAFSRIRCTQLHTGDVLIARMPDPLGRACLFPDIGQRSITAVDVAILRPNNSDIDNRWLVYAINAPMIRGQMELLSSGTTRQRVTRKNLGGIELGVPSIEEQREIVRRVESLFAYADRLEARYANGRAQTEHLTPALLAKAFRGELVPQDPNDEPASVLLERIRAERVIKPAKPSRGLKVS